MTAQPAESPAEAVQRQTKSPASTTSTTLNLLRALLGYELVCKQPPPASANRRQPNSQTGRKNIQTAKPVTKRLKSSKLPSAIEFEIYDGSKTVTSPLPTDKRRTLATITFNSTLKNLSDAAKITHTQSDEQTSQRREAASQNALKNCSPNRQYRPTVNTKPTSRLSTGSSGSLDGIEITAECASTALRCLLRSFQPNDRAGEKSRPENDWRLERGALVLLDKLTTLKLTGLAQREAFFIKLHLQSRLRSNPESNSTQDEGQYSTTDEKSIAESLLIEFDLTNKTLFNLITSFQSQIIRVALLLGRTCITKKLVEALRPTCQFGPCPVILQGVKSGAISAEQGAQQLRTLSQALMNLCSSSDRHLEAAKQTAPETVFSLRCVALEIRCYSWALLTNARSAENEIWTHFSRALCRYQEESKPPGNEKYEPARAAVSALQEVSLLAGAQSRPPGFVLDSLADMAQRSGLVAESLALLESQIADFDDNNEGLSRVLCQCKIATMRLAIWHDDRKVSLLAAEKALELLKGCLKGSTSELNNLMLHGARLRRTALTTATDIEQLISKQEVDETHISLQMCAIRIVFGFVHFVLRFMKSQSLKGQSTHFAEKQMEEKRAMESIAQKAIDSVLTVSKYANSRTTIPWQETDTALRECLLIAQLIDEHFSAKSDSSEHMHSAFTRISNFYWSQYLSSKEHSISLKERVQCLESSVSAVSNRSLFEQQQSFLALKYERLASTYIEAHFPQKAKEALRSAIILQIKLGALAEAVEISLSKPSSCTWSDSNHKAFTLGKNLTAFVQIPLQQDAVSRVCNFIYDDDNLPDIHRAILLERQVLTLASFPVPDQLRTFLITYSKMVFDLYKSPSYQICRLRFSCQLLEITSKNEEFPIIEILDDKIDGLISSTDADFSEQRFLATYRDVLCATLRLHWAFQTGKPSSEFLDQVMTDLYTWISRCEDESSLQTIVDDSPSLKKQLQSVADYAGMLELNTVKMKALLTMQSLAECQGRNGFSDLTTCLTQIGSLQTRLGNTGEAGRSFAAAEKYLTKVEVGVSVSMQWRLAYAEYLLDLSNFKKCSEILEVTRSINDADLKVSSESVRRRTRLEREACLSQAALLASRMKFGCGDLASSLKFARQCVKLSTGVWMSLEKTWDETSIHGESSAPEHSLQSLSEGMSNLSFTLDRTITRSVPKGASFWPYVDLHLRALLHVSSLCAHSGLYQDAVHYAEQARKLGLTTHSGLITVKAQSALSLLYSQGGHTQNSIECLEAVQSNLASISEQQDAYYIFLDQATVHISNGDVGRARDYLAQARMALKTIETWSSDKGRHLPERFDLDEAVKSLTISDTKTSKDIRKTQSRLVVAKLQPAKTNGVQDVKKPLVVKKKDSGAHARNQALSDGINILEARVALLLGDMKAAKSYLEQASSSSSGLQAAQRRLVEASLMLSQALDGFSSDAVHCVLAETAIGLPSRYWRDRMSVDASATQRPIPSNVPANNRNQTVKTPRSRVKKSEPNETQPQDILRKAHGLLSSGYSSNLNESSSIDINRTEKLLSHLSLLSSVVCADTQYSPVQFISQSLLPAELMRQREHWAMAADITTADRSQLEKWPHLSANEQQNMDCPDRIVLPSIDVELQKSLPASWVVFTLSINEEKSDLLLSKICSGRTPFVLRIPLSRSSVEEVEDMDFTFEIAKNELAEIISQANLTAHDARGQGDKQARKLWWAERERLDQRLEVLLKNLENIWLGGFRGMLSLVRVDQALLSRFAESLAQSLDKHLPSRQRAGAASKTKILLHAHVVELFVALGNPDDNELDDSITDLLYFVVDILQFSGERNAYDEIDFDIIMLEVTDALRSYHESHSSRIGEEGQHTILVLDKELHAFPWESLPCLSGQSVSRMASLGAIQERLEKIREHDKEAQTHTIPLRCGSYILNPSSDLTSTQETFAPPFAAQLPDFAKIINRVPSEKEFESCLHDHPLLLYFGHGSGAQYIRGRTIKKLDKCAVTFLMGCSSGKMIECGEYEPYGVPWNYMYAGSPAVVGTLWDVTDKDIDRFAMRAFTNWGLLDAEAVEEGLKGKGKAKKTKSGKSRAREAVVEKDERAGRMTLDEAVAKARDSCVLRYLNGAAPVIYGVPVSLG